MFKSNGLGTYRYSRWDGSKKKKEKKLLLKPGERSEN